MLRNRDMKLELEALRQWLDLYSLQEERLSRSQIHPEYHLKSVNEQLHFEKDILYHMIFDIILLQLSRNPGTIPTIRHLYFEQVFKRMNPEFVAQFEQQQQQAGEIQMLSREFFQNEQSDPMRAFGMRMNDSKSNLGSPLEVPIPPLRATKQHKWNILGKRSNNGKPHAMSYSQFKNDRIDSEDSQHNSFFRQTTPLLD